ncbi:MAG TPA: FHA domain-containing protein [Bacteroidetes bacterium]|nr:FHA domain-containing protein [Bacteroidota bacterium]
MARSTQPNLGRNLAATIKQGFQMMAGRDMPNYTLLFLDPAKNQERGNHKNYVLNHMDIGRSSGCDLQYGDNYSTVSRKHASISLRDGNFILQHNPSAANPTLVNGQPVQSHQLQNGDEIQFSSGGPRVRFNTSAVKTSTMGFTARMAMWSNQALRPYKYGIAALAILLMSTALYTVYSKVNSDRQIAAMEKEKNELAAKQESLERDQQALNDELSAKEKQLKQLEKKNRSQSVEASRLRKEISRISSQVESVREEIKTVTDPALPGSGGANLPSGNVSSGLTDEQASALLPKENIYLIRAVKFDVPYVKDISEKAMFKEVYDEYKILKKGIYAGTGFLADDGKFVTARHIVQSWRYLNPYADFKTVNPTALYLLLMNYLETERGSKVDIIFEATDQSGNTLRFKSSQFRFDDTHDISYVVSIPKQDSNDTLSIKIKSSRGGANNSDWAYINVNQESSITYKPIELKDNLKPGIKLYSLGYSEGMNLQESDKFSAPLFGVTTLARAVQSDNMLYITDRSFTHGNSGGPIFVIVNNRPVVVGIVSSGRDNLGDIVSISQLY